MSRCTIASSRLCARDVAAFCLVVEVVSSGWSFWGWILWAGDLEGLK